MRSRAVGPEWKAAYFRQPARLTSFGSIVLADLNAAGSLVPCGEETGQSRAPNLSNVIGEGTSQSPLRTSPLAGIRGGRLEADAR